MKSECMCVAACHDLSSTQAAGLHLAITCQSARVLSILMMQTSHILNAEF